jgi:hypothetical protein
MYFSHVKFERQQEIKLSNHWVKIAFGFFFIVACIGALLRATGYIPLNLKYKYLVHAHSHVAFQGWVYISLTVLLLQLFLNKQQIKAGKYNLQLFITTVVIIGVLVSFSLQGYGLYSIVFSTLFQVLNYWFFICFFKDLKHFNSLPTVATRFVKTGIWLGVMSTLLPYVIGVLSAKGFKGSEIYNAAIYTFLHLQYNGWFLFVSLGLFFKVLEQQQLKFNQRAARMFYRLMTITVIPAITLSMLGLSFAQYIKPIAIISSLLTLFALYYFIKLLRAISLTEFHKSTSKISLLVLCVFLISLSTKQVLQSISVIPFYQEFAFSNKPIILAYLHLSLIGVISFLILWLMLVEQLISVSTLSKLGIGMLSIGFVASELALISNGLGITHGRIILLSSSSLMVVGIFEILLAKFVNNSS